MILARFLRFVFIDFHSFQVVGLLTLFFPPEEHTRKGNGMHLYMHTVPFFMVLTGSILYCRPADQNSWGMALTWRAVKTGPSLQT
jgi:hypothetical protein